jgi:glycosyltransferase involved in cell wall biosynthesis
MKILITLTGLGMGGAEKVVTSLSDALAAGGHSILLVYMTGVALVVPSDPRVKMVGLGIALKSDAFSAFFKLRKIIRTFQPDVVHSHMVHANIFSRLVRLTTPIRRLISTAHSSNEGGRLRMLAYQLTDSLADISTNVSAMAVGAFEERKAVKPGRMIPVHNGISTSHFSFDATTRVSIRAELGVDAECRLILAVGRMHEAKDYPNLLKALAQLRAAGLTFKTCIVGEGSLRGKLEAMVSALELSDYVQFLGIRHDVPDLMSAADVFVLPSAWEGFGLVVAEAMACERVVVATDCGGVQEVLGDAGYLVRPRDSNALAGALQSALRLPALEAASMGHAARQRVVERYSLDAAVEKWLEIYAGNFKCAVPLTVKAVSN